ncbi:extracellular solute-binding protein [soil metagenome]
MPAKRQNTRASAFAAAALLSLVLGGCVAAPDGGSDPNNPDQVEVFSGWTTITDRAGFDALIDVFGSQNPDIDLIDASVAGGGGSAARAALTARLESGNPPDTFLATAGAGLTDYVESNQLQDLTGFYEQHQLDAVYRDTFLDLLRVDGKIYSVPVDIRRANIVWTNSTLLRRAGVDPAVGRTTIRYWLADLNRLRDSGIDYPLALGEDWTEVQLFENVLIADFGPVVYKDLWKNQEPWHSPALQTAVDDYNDLLDFVDPASLAEDARDAIHRVVNGNAAYVVMIDTAAADFQQAGTSGLEYASFPVPGTKSVFDFAVDSFTLPVQVAHEDGAKAWLVSASSVDGQVALNTKTGSIPARIDVDPDTFPAAQRAAVVSLQNDTVAPSLSNGIAASPTWTAAITDAVAKFRTVRRPDALTNALIAAAKAALD